MYPSQKNEFDKEPELCAPKVEAYRALVEADQPYQTAVAITLSNLCTFL